MDEIAKLEILIENGEKVINKLAEEIVKGSPARMYEVYAKLSANLVGSYELLYKLKNKK